MFTSQPQYLIYRYISLPTNFIGFMHHYLSKLPNNCFHPQKHPADIQHCQLQIDIVNFKSITSPSKTFSCTKQDSWSTELLICSCLINHLFIYFLFLVALTLATIQHSCVYPVIKGQSIYLLWRTLLWTKGPGNQNIKNHCFPVTLLERSQISQCDYQRL